MVGAMRILAALLLLIAAPAVAQTPLPTPLPAPLPAPLPVPYVPGGPWQPTAPYVILGQDEPGYRNWVAASPRHPVYVKAFHDYLTNWGVAGVVPTWQLLRSASDWMKCGAPPFEVPPTEYWPNVVQSLRYIRDQVIPAIGPVEPVSVYRNPALNLCAHGANESAHRFMQAIDMVPLRPMTRETLIHYLCTLHARSGERYSVGLGFYTFVRFHIDARKYRKWGAGTGPEAAACLYQVTVTNAVPVPSPPISAPVSAPLSAQADLPPK